MMTSEFSEVVYVDSLVTGSNGIKIRKKADR